MVTMTYDDAQKSYEEFVASRASMNDYTVSLSQDIARIGALETIEMIDSAPSFKDKAAFCKKLLLNAHVVVKCKDKIVAQFTMLPQMEWFAVPEFAAEPYALKFLITAVYGRFLKYAAGKLHGSQNPPPEAEKEPGVGLTN